MTNYPANGPVHARLRLPAGRIEVRTHDAPEASLRVEVLRGPSSALQDVRQDVRATDDGGLEIEVEYERRWGGLFGGGASFLFDVHVPHGAELDASTASADVTVEGMLGRAKVESASGDVRMGTVTGDLRVSSASGDQRVDAVGGSATLSSASGSQRVARVDGDVQANGVSGGLRLGRAAGEVRANTVSGSIRIDEVSGRGVDAKSVSGSIRIGVRRGLRVWLDLSSRSGSTKSDLEPANEGASQGRAQVAIRATSVSGSIKVERAEPSADDEAESPASSRPAEGGAAAAGKGIYLGGA
jgi:hypothetical protein